MCQSVCRAAWVYSRYIGNHAYAPAGALLDIAVLDQPDAVTVLRFHRSGA
jgi:hypothetical protein